MQKLAYVKPTNAPQAKTGNLPKGVVGRGHFNKVSFTGDEPPAKVVLTNKELAKMRRAKSKRDGTVSGSITTNWNPILIG